MRKNNVWKKSLAFAFSLTLAAACLPAAAYSSGGSILSASAAEEVSENDAILAYLNGLCKSKYDDEEDEDYKRLLFSEKALSAYQAGEKDYKLTTSLRGFTAKGNTNSDRFMESCDHESDLGYYFDFSLLIEENIVYIITEDEYKAFLETQPQEPLKDTYEVSTAKEFEKAVDAVTSADDGVTRTIKLTADITDFSALEDGRGTAIPFRFKAKAVIDLNGFTFKCDNEADHIYFYTETENTELTIMDSSTNVSGTLSINSIDCNAGRLNITSGTFDCYSIGNYSANNGITITGGKFIIDPEDCIIFSHDELDSYTPLGYESVKTDTINKREVFEVRKADTDKSTEEEFYEPLLSAVKERLENGFSNYSDTDEPISGAFTIPSEEIQFSSMWYIPFENFTPENTGYALIDINRDGRKELITGSIAEDGTTTVFDIYALFRNRPWHLAAANERDYFFIGKGKQILEKASNGADSSYIASYYIECNSLYSNRAYKTEDGVTYKQNYVYSEEIGDYVPEWRKTDQKPEDDEYLQYELMNVELTPFSEFKSASNERVLINATTKGNGQIAGSDDGSEPVFDDEYPFQQAIYNANKGTTIKLSAKADEGWTFKEWKNKQTRETYSTDASVTIDANEALELVAVFAADDAVEHTFTDDQLEIWAEKDYQDKTGAAVRAEITSWSDNEYEITLTDKDENTLDTYTIDPDTGKGKKSDGHRVNLPKTGMSGSHKAIAGLAALMSITGMALVNKKREKD